FCSVSPLSLLSSLSLHDALPIFGLAAETLQEGDWKFAQDHLRILSGLYGLLAPLDLIQPYRLEMGTRLANPRGKDLYEFWGARIDRKSTRLNSSHVSISYAVFCL